MYAASICPFCHAAYISLGCISSKFTSFSVNPAFSIACKSEKCAVEANGVATVLPFKSSTDLISAAFLETRLSTEPKTS